MDKYADWFITECETMFVIFQVKKQKFAVVSCSHKTLESDVYRTKYKGIWIFLKKSIRVFIDFWNWIQKWYILNNCHLYCKYVFMTSNTNEWNDQTFFQKFQIETYEISKHLFFHIIVMNTNVSYEGYIIFW